MRRFWWVPATGLVVVVLLAVVVISGSTGGGRVLPPTRARTYSSFQACLLTGARGLADPEVAPVWAGMQDASKATRAEVSYLSAMGPAVESNAMPYVASLAQRHCGIIVAVGTPQIQAAQNGAGTWPDIKFVTVGGGTASSNVSIVTASAPAAVRADVAAIVQNDDH